MSLSPSSVGGIPGFISTFPFVSNRALWGSRQVINDTDYSLAKPDVKLLENEVRHQALMVPPSGIGTNMGCFDATGCPNLRAAIRSVVKRTSAPRNID